MGNAASAISFTIRAEGDISPINNTSAQLRDLAGSMQKVSVYKVSKIALIHASRGVLVHYGIVLKNTFSIDDKVTFPYLLIHALVQTDDNTKLKFDFYFSSSLRHAKARVASLLKVDDAHISDFCNVKFYNMRDIVDKVHQLLNSPFTPLCKETAQMLATQEYFNQANCVIAAITLYALLLNEDPDLAVEKFMASRRGELLRTASTDISTLSDGVPCSDVAFWTTLKERVAPDGGIVRLQVHKLELIPPNMYLTLVGPFALTARVVRKKAAWSIHNAKFRVIVKPHDARQWMYAWRDVARSDDINEMQNIFTDYTFGAVQLDVPAVSVEVN